MNEQTCAECGTTVDTDYEIDPEWVCPFCEEELQDEQPRLASEQ